MFVHCEFAVAKLLLKSLCGLNKAYRQETGTRRVECGHLCETDNTCNACTYNCCNGLSQLCADVEKTALS